MDKRLGIIMHGVTGRIGTNQHLGRALATLRKEGVALANGDVLVLDPILVGRDAAKLEQVARRFGIERWTTDLDAALGDADDSVFFDSAVTGLRYASVERALQAGKHVFCDKPLAPTHAEALALAGQAGARQRKNGVVMANLWLPGLVKLRALVEAGFFGEILSIRGEFGYWVHEGDGAPAQRPSWNYRKQDSGGIVLDVMCHWHYILEGLFARPARVSCLTRTLQPQRWDEQRAPYAATAEDMAFVMAELDGGVPVQIGLSWCTRVRRDDLITIQVDGTLGSAVAGIFECHTQQRAGTPSLVWNAEDRPALDYRANWTPYAPDTRYPNAFTAQWERFLRHVVEDAPFPWDFAAAARGLAMVEACYRSAARGTWETVPA